MDGKASQRLKFDQAGDWAVNFGDSNGDGVLEKSGATSSGAPWARCASRSMIRPWPTASCPRG
jgi:hypothetical protein